MRAAGRPPGPRQPFLKVAYKRMDLLATALEEQLLTATVAREGQDLQRHAVEHAEREVGRACGFLQRAIAGHWSHGWRGNRFFDTPMILSIVAGALRGDSTLSELRDGLGTARGAWVATAAPFAAALDDVRDAERRVLHAALRALDGALLAARAGRALGEWLVRGPHLPFLPDAVVRTHDAQQHPMEAGRL